MPELPEAETLARGLRPVLTGERIEGATVHYGDVLRVPAARFRARVAGRRIMGVSRRAKNVLVELDDGVLVVNLGMTGWLAPLGFPDRPLLRPTHPAVTFRLGEGRRLVFNDIRRFGCLEALDPEAWAERSARLGPEPLEPAFTPEVLGAALARSRSPLRSWLLDQRRIAGVGNIYACESAFLAGVRPERPANAITRDEVVLLHRGIVDVLAASVAMGGTTIRDYLNAEGGTGEFVGSLRVYGREGEPCRSCGATVERSVFGNRSAFFCPECQR